MQKTVESTNTFRFLYKTLRKCILHRIAYRMYYKVVYAVKVLIESIISYGEFNRFGSADVIVTNMNINMMCAYSLLKYETISTVRAS